VVTKVGTSYKKRRQYQHFSNFLRKWINWEETTRSLEAHSFHLRAHVGLFRLEMAIGGITEARLEHSEEMEIYRRNPLKKLFKIKKSL